MELQKDSKGHNLVTYFMWYMMNRWNINEAIVIFGEDLGKHIHSKWVEVIDYGDGDQLRFYANLDTVCRNKLVARSLEIYDKKEKEE